MKHLFTATAFLFLAQFAQAKTMCSINTSTQDVATFGKVLFIAEPARSTMVIQKVGSDTIEKFNINEFDSLAKWDAINGSTVIAFKEGENNEVTISAGVIDSSNQASLLKAEALAAGTVAEKQPVSLVLFGKNLAISCSHL